MSEVIAPRRRKRTVPALPPPDSIKQQDGFVFSKPEPKKRKVHRKVKLPEYPSMLADASIEKITVSSIPDQAFVEIAEAVSKGHIHAARETFTGPFEFIANAAERVCQTWYAELKKSDSEFRTKMRSRIDSENEKLKHNSNNAFLLVRKGKLEAAIARLENESKQWNQVEEKVKVISASLESLIQSSSKDQLSTLVEKQKQSLKLPPIIETLNTRIEDLALNATALAQDVGEVVSKIEEIQSSRELAARQMYEQRSKDSLQEFECEKTRDIALDLLNSL